MCPSPKHTLTRLNLVDIQDILHVRGFFAPADVHVGQTAAECECPLVSNPCSLNSIYFIPLHFWTSFLSLKVQTSRKLFKSGVLHRLNLCIRLVSSFLFYLGLHLDFQPDPDAYSRTLFLIVVPYCTL